MTVLFSLPVLKIARYSRQKLESKNTNKYLHSVNCLLKHGRLLETKLKKARVGKINNTIVDTVSDAVRCRIARRGQFFYVLSLVVRFSKMSDDARSARVFFLASGQFRVDDKNSEQHWTTCCFGSQFWKFGTIARAAEHGCDEEEKVEQVF